MKLTVIILTRNEQRHISDCLAGLKNQGTGPDLDLLVIDDGSDDGTADLARAAGARVVEHRLTTFAEQRNFALSQAAGGWVFFLDADERFSPDLLPAIARHMGDHPGAAGSVVRRNFAFGQRHRFGPLKPDRVVRLFPPDSMHWEGRVHERPVFDIPVRALDGHLRHLTYHSWGQYLTKQRRYADIWAEEARAAGRQATPLTAFCRAGAGFLKMFVLNLGLLGGPVAWCLCWYHGTYTLTKYLKLADGGPER